MDEAKSDLETKLPYRRSELQAGERRSGRNARNAVKSGTQVGLRKPGSEVIYRTPDLPSLLIIYQLRDSGKFKPLSHRFSVIKLRYEIKWKHYHHVHLSVKSYTHTDYDDLRGGRDTGILTAQARESDSDRKSVRLYFMEDLGTSRNHGGIEILYRKPEHV